MKGLQLCCSLLACLSITLGYPVSWWTDGSPYASHDRLTRRVPTYEDRDCYPFVTVEDEFDPYLTVDRPARETDAYQRMLADDVALYASMMPNRMYQWRIQEAPASPGQYVYAQESPAERFAYAAQDDYPQERVLLLEPMPPGYRMMPPSFSPVAVNEQRSNKVDMRETPQSKMEEKEMIQKKEEQLPRKQKQFKRQPMDDPTEHADQ